MIRVAARKSLDGFAIGLMVLLCACWGLQQVALKAAAPAMHPMLQVGIRSFGAAVLVGILTRWRREGFSLRDGTLLPGIGAGLLFAGEFLVVSIGLEFTTASHMAVFLYTAPVFTALGLHFLVKGEELRPAQWAGVAIAAGGVLFAFSAGMGETTTEAKNVVLGDALGILGGIFWAGTTLLIRKSSLSEAPAGKTLVYQLGVAALVLLPLALAMGKWESVRPSPTMWWCLAFQTVIVSFVSFLVWFWMLRTYLASRLSVFSFLTPLFGVTFGFLLLGEKPDPRFIGGAVLVLTGITVVNRKAARVKIQAGCRK
jgi:drug/metabolite transporter (DMT)-like permease